MSAEEDIGVEKLDETLISLCYTVWARTFVVTSRTYMAGATACYVLRDKVEEEDRR